MTHMNLPINADDDMMEAGVKAGRAVEPNTKGEIGFVQVRAIYDAMLKAHRLKLAERITQSVITTLGKGGDNLAIYNAVRNELVQS